MKMIKKLSLSIVAMLFTLTLFSQTIVSTSTENRNVVLEEYTGIHCVWCPSGHVIAQTLQDNNPDDVYLINIHVGGFANPSGDEPDFRTPFGSAIANEAGVAFYPAGSINRHVFSGGASAMDRNQWTSAANTTIGQSSYVNVGVEADINVQTNELTVHVEAYYTGDSNEDSNFLNIALLQNDTKGPQTGGNMGNEYNHMHRLVHLITGQWGVSLPVTTTGTFVDETFTYTIPEDYNGVLVEVADLEVVAFVTETHQEIESGSGAYPTYSGIANANDVNVRYIEDISTQCNSTITPSVNIQNFGQNDITALAIEYSVNGGASETYNWTGNLSTLQNETIELPEISYTIQDVNEVTVSTPNDDDNTNNIQNNTFERAVVSTNYVDLELHTDGWGSECTWNIKDVNGTTIYSGGPYGNNQTINESFVLDENCYTFNLLDSYGDGGGAVNLTDNEGTVIYNTSGAYGSGESTNFSTEGILGVTDNELHNVIIYPNPVNSVLNINNAENSTIEIFDLLGRVILTQNNISLAHQVNVSNLITGTYLIKISNENKIKTDKFIINR